MDIIEALNSIVWYNGIYDFLEDVKNGVSKCNIGYYNHTYPMGEQEQIFWMLLVLLFGDYGTSPRSGWLEMEHKEEILDFIDRLTTIDGEYMGDI